MKRRKREAEAFDVVEFLRATDTDLRSALTTMLTPSETPVAVRESNLGPGVNLEPGSNVDPPPILTPPPASPVASVAPLAAASPLPPPASTLPPTGQPHPSLVRSRSTFPPTPTPPVNPSNYFVSGPARVKIYPVNHLHDGHTRAERLLYETLWSLSQPYDAHSRLITIGFATLAKCSGLSESNTRINLRSLIRKQAIEEFDSYDCALSRGRTYRIFDEAAVLERRRALGLQWYRKRTMGVMFVDPTTGEPIAL